MDRLTGERPISRLGGLISFTAIVSILWLLLRTIHLVIPLYYPEVLEGPFSLDDPSQVEAYSAFSPLMPFFRPETLGDRPIHITVYRQPSTRVVVFWQAERFLYLDENPGGPWPMDLPSDATELPIGVRAVLWQRGSTVHVVAQIDDVVVRLKTDLSLADAGRIVQTLRPYEELR